MPQICKLLDANENKPADVRLPISAFDLDHESRQRKIADAKLERDKARRELEEKCAQRDQIALYLRDVFWDPLEVKPCALRSISGDTIVRNYPLVASNRKKNDFKAWDKLSADTDEFLYRQ